MLIKDKIDFWLNHNPIIIDSSLPKILKKFGFKRFGGRARSIIFAFEYININTKKGYSNGLKNIAEFGVANGEGFRQLVLIAEWYCKLKNISLPNFYGFDTFNGMPDIEGEYDLGTWEKGDYPGDLDKLKKLFSNSRFEKNVFFKKGLFKDTLNKVKKFNPDFILVDCDYYSSTRDIFLLLKDKLNPGTVIYFDDLWTNFGNKNLGEERFIYELNDGRFGQQFYLAKLRERVYVWSNSDKPINKVNSKILDIPLKQELKLNKTY